MNRQIQPNATSSASHNTCKCHYAEPLPEKKTHRIQLLQHHYNLLVISHYNVTKQKVIRCTYPLQKQDDKHLEEFELI